MSSLSCTGILEIYFAVQLYFSCYLYITLNDNLIDLGVKMFLWISALSVLHIIDWARHVMPPQYTPVLDAT